MAWLKGFANDRLPDEVRAANVLMIKDWFKKILRMNKVKCISVCACTDTVLLNVLNCC